MGKVFLQVSDVDLADVLASLRDGDDVVLMDGDRDVAEVTTREPRQGARQFGSLKGKVHLDESFWDPLPEDELRLWNGEGR